MLDDINETYNDLLIVFNHETVPKFYPRKGKFVNDFRDSAEDRDMKLKNITIITINWIEAERGLYNTKKNCGCWM